MSEYQYYEFVAIDRPLDENAQETLRSISSRARISASRFTNHYEWGDLKGNPREFMERWFDLHLYLSNWGTRRLMMRLPKRLLDSKEIDRFVRDLDWVEVWTHGDNLIVDMFREEVEPDEDDLEDGPGWLAGFAPLRTDALSNDHRLFYLLWLTKVQDGQAADDEVEPLPGIGPLTGSLDAFAEFFAIDPFLVHVAAELPAPATRRTVGALRMRAQEIASARERAIAERREAERRRQAQEAEKARRASLEALKRRGERVWQQIEEEIGRRSTNSYDRAANLLSDLQVLAVEEGSQDDFRRRLAALRARHEKKPRFRQRLDRLGLDNPERKA